MHTARSSIRGRATVGTAVLGLVAMASLVAAAPAAAQTSSGTPTTLGPSSGTLPVTTTTLSCSVLGLFTVPLTVSTFAQAPGSVLAGMPVDLTSVRNEVSIPATFVDLAMSFGLTKLSGTISTMDFNATDASPATVNAAATPLAFGPVPLTANQPATFFVPATPATVGPWTAGNRGTIGFSLGNVDLKVLVPITCMPVAPAPTLGTTLIQPALG